MHKHMYCEVLGFAPFPTKATSKLVIPNKAVHFLFSITGFSMTWWMRMSWSTLSTYPDVRTRRERRRKATILVWMLYGYRRRYSKNRLGNYPSVHYINQTSTCRYYKLLIRDIDIAFDSSGMASDYNNWLLGPTWEATEVDRIQNSFQKFRTGKKE